MKITVDVECTPEEARRAMGLPDLTPLHERYVTMIGDAMQGGIKPEAVEAMMRGWAPVGDAGMAMWRRLFESGGQGGA